MKTNGKSGCGVTLIEMQEFFVPDYPHRCEGCQMQTFLELKPSALDLECWLIDSSLEWLVVEMRRAR